MERNGQRCAYCRSPMLVGIPMVVDHIMPLVAGGSSALDNLCLACYRCNEFKGSRTEAANPRDGQMTRSSIRAGNGGVTISSGTRTAI